MKMLRLTGDKSICLKMKHSVNKKPLRNGKSGDWSPGFPFPDFLKSSIFIRGDKKVISRSEVSNMDNDPDACYAIYYL